MPRIILVDDSQFQRKMMKGYLEELNLEILEASNGLEGLELFNSVKPDLMILDLLMPKKNGLEVLEEIKNYDKKTPIIIVSADIQETTKAKIEELGAYEFINKPPKKELLVGTVKKALNI